MERQDSKELVYRFAEMASNHDWNRLGEVYAADYVQHEPLIAQGLDGLRSFFEAQTAALPELEGRLEDVVSEGDRVVARMTWEGTHRGEFLGIAPTGKRVTYGTIEIWRAEGGMLVEHWDQFDLYGLMRQLGAVPAIGS